ncbi:hypothetical protein DR64_7598 [Paraburkholderia xenovorans LB400]|uniref:Outer membrane porin, OmpC family n=1 Tax=Paraburkholderia xenovorans (strain LB400) TaxID=266265 RepID=Q13GR1_PARXL|nr:porin [Paraburkholderia xenovorans]ABE36728.1 outer membrane porin, OmpC family [Paraburkholderia xenovorans LB400]AIP35088.1 hypothetical protein DR64_7598 [Paraburkholderia xenovorans LB400]
MKPIRYQHACAVMFLIAGAAHAQSSVTLYGVVTDGLNFTSNGGGHTSFRMQSGDVPNSRWGLLGSEDLGGGYKAVFRLENGFDVNTGALQQGGREFGRQAYVGLASDRYGTLTLGRQYDPTVDLFSGFTGAGSWAGVAAGHPFDNDNTDWDFRVNNAIKYVSQNWHGLTVEGMYAFSDQAGGFADNRLYSAAVQYQNGGLRAAAAYLKINNGGLATGAVTSDTVFTGSSEQNIDAGVSYRFEKAQVSLAYSHVDMYDPTAGVWLPAAGVQPRGGKWNAWKFNNIEVNGQYFLPHGFSVGAAYTFTAARLASTVGEYSPKWHQLALMLNYDLSKRTAVYLQGAYQHVVSAHTGTDFDFAQIPLIGAGLSSSVNQGVIRVAMVHRF